jgi:hypothetical protein
VRAGGPLDRARDERPEQAAAAHGQRGGQRDERVDQGDQQAHGRGGAERSVVGKGRQEQGEQGEHDRDVAGDDGRDRAPVRVAEGGSTIRGLAEFLAVAGHQEQSVVGSGTEDEDGDDAGGGPVDGDVECLADLGDQQRCDAVSDTDDDQRDEPEHRRAVGDDEQYRDDQGRGRQESEVGALERGSGVSGEPRAAGELGADALVETVGDGVPHLRHQVAGRAPGEELGVDRHQHEGGGAVLGRDGALCGSTDDLGHALAGTDGRGDALGPQLAAVLAGHDEDRRNGLGPRELALDLGDECGLGVVRERLWPLRRALR